eukprot:Rmarinus@m.23359
MSTPNLPIKKVHIHPLVLLSVVDHYSRAIKDRKKRAVGVLLGARDSDGVLDISNSYAIPFDEDEKGEPVWFLDFNYHQVMHRMSRKINARETIVGWYSTGPKIRPNDIAINTVFKKEIPHPVMVIIDIGMSGFGFPTDAYVAVEEVKEDGSQISETFQHLPSEIKALEAEEIGVEHLLRDIRDTTVSSVSEDVSYKLQALRGLEARLQEIVAYLDRVVDGKLPVNHEIIYRIQDIFNLLPNLNVPELLRSFTGKTNDMLLSVYLCSLIRSIIALHNCISNKLDNKRKKDAAVKGAEKKPAEGKEESESESAKAEKKTGDAEMKEADSSK